MTKALTIPWWCSWNYVGELLQLGHKESVHVVGVRVKSSRESQSRMKSELFETKRRKIFMFYSVSYLLLKYFHWLSNLLGKAFLAKVESCGN